MSYNDKKNENIEIDDMNIRSHLDTSLELSGISVSEDLINRTLEAIKKQTAGQPAEESQAGSKSVTKKVIPWNRYIRGFAGVAAAVVVVAAGYSFLSNGGLFSKKDANFSANSLVAEDSTANTAAEGTTDGSAALSAPSESSNATAKTDENTTNDATSAGAADGETSQNTSTDSTPETTTQFTVEADTALGSDEAGNTGSADTSASSAADSSATYGIAADRAMTATAPAVTGTADSTASSDIAASLAVQPTAILGIAGNTTLTFRDIFLPEPEKAEYIKITDVVSGTSITLTDQTQIADFYSIMDKHQFTYSSKTSADQNYSVEINDPQMSATYVMSIGEHITVSYSDKDVSSVSSYDVADSALLTQNLQAFIAKYSK
ncbi:MAG TPA: hypothetical protein VN258_03715 [Mobilitalea sp.]|nr:hypothetical protein [Mobilitalea sp.]